jgi:hypothetical protein
LASLSLFDFRKRIDCSRIDTPFPNLALLLLWVLRELQHPLDEKSKVFDGKS